MGLEYISPAVAYQQAGERIADDQLQEKVAEYLGGVWPQGFEDADMPKAVFAPYLAKGSVIEVEFLQMAREADFDTIIATYKDAEYVTANAAVVDCYRAPLIGTKGQCLRQWVVPPSQRCGSVGNAETVYPGLDIVDYWTGVRSAVLMANGLSPDDLVVDFGGWYQTQSERFGWQGERSKSTYYYMALMGLYASGRAVLFDTPPTAFASNIMEPAAIRAEKSLGAKPLITCELRPAKRDWTDVSFLDEGNYQKLVQTGKIEMNV